MDKIKYYKKDMFNTEEINLVDLVVNSRPKPYRQYDQIYMKAGDMLRQLYCIADDIENKNMIFLGDDDGMSILIGLFAEANLIRKPNSITVFDFDERIINNTKRMFDKYNLNKSILLDTCLYNIIDKIPDSYIGKFDYFYINPPYGAFNNGMSCKLWLHRCIELCNDLCEGCIIIPSSVIGESWRNHEMYEIQGFLNEKGFIISETTAGIHNYHLDENLLSTYIVVQKVKKSKSEYAGEQFTLNLVKNLYGKSIGIPHSIRDNGEYEQLDMDWEYGRLRNFVIPKRKE